MKLKRSNFLSNWNKFLGEHEQVPQKVSVDFDDTICSLETKAPNLQLIQKLQGLIQDGISVFVVSARKNTPENHLYIAEFLQRNGLSVQGIYLTDNNAKVLWLMELGVQHHFDNDLSEIEAIKSFANGIGTTLVDTFWSSDEREGLDEAMSYSSS